MRPHDVLLEVEKPCILDPGPARQKHVTPVAFRQSVEFNCRLVGAVAIEMTHHDLSRCCTLSRISSGVRRLGNLIPAVMAEFMPTPYRGVPGVPHAPEVLFQNCFLGAQVCLFWLASSSSTEFRSECCSNSRKSQKAPE